MERLSAGGALAVAARTGQLPASARMAAMCMCNNDVQHAMPICNVQALVHMYCRVHMYLSLHVHRCQGRGPILKATLGWKALCTYLN